MLKITVTIKKNNNGVNGSWKNRVWWITTKFYACGQACHRLLRPTQFTTPIIIYFKINKLWAIFHLCTPIYQSFQRYLGLHWTFGPVKVELLLDQNKLTQFKCNILFSCTVEFVYNEQACNEIRLITKRILNPNNVFITQTWHDITKKIAEQTNRLPVFCYAWTITY